MPKIQPGDPVRIKADIEEESLIGVANEYSPYDNVWYVETYELGIVLVLPSDLERIPVV